MGGDISTCLRDLQNQLDSSLYVASKFEVRGRAFVVAQLYLDVIICSEVTFTVLERIKSDTRATAHNLFGNGFLA